jgi:glucose/arabinose dehydrogenase
MRILRAPPWVLLSLIGCSTREPPAPAPGPTVADSGAATADSAAAEARAEDPGPATNLPLDRLRLPEGFEISVYAEGLEGARSMALGESTLFVGTRDPGRVYALHELGATRPARTSVLLEGLDIPNGVAMRDGDLYVAQRSQVIRLRDVEEHLDDPPTPEDVGPAYPTEAAHGWRYAAFGPDGWLYVAVGAPCNVCEPPADIFATITRLHPQTGQREIWARGVRNTLGYDWHPQTGDLWFTDNGRDWLGNDAPPDELNRAPRSGLHFGFPYCHGGDIEDPELGTRGCEEFTPPVQRLGPHVAALGMRFYTGRMFPAAYREQIFIAEHGSWNRDTPIGYRITLVRLEGSRAVSYEPFITGWLQDDGQPWGRPVDVLVMPDGALLISDDHAGAIYRVSYRRP